MKTVEETLAVYMHPQGLLDQAKALEDVLTEIIETIECGKAGVAAKYCVKLRTGVRHEMLKIENDLNGPYQG